MRGHLLGSEARRLVPIPLSGRGARGRRSGAGAGGRASSRVRQGRPRRAPARSDVITPHQNLLHGALRGHGGGCGVCVRRVQREERGEQHWLEVGGVEALEVLPDTQQHRHRCRGGALPDEEEGECGKHGVDVGDCHGPGSPGRLDEDLRVGRLGQGGEVAPSLRLVGGGAQLSLEGNSPAAVSLRRRAGRRRVGGPVGGRARQVVAELRVLPDRAAPLHCKELAPWQVNPPVVWGDADGAGEPEHGD